MAFRGPQEDRQLIRELIGAYSDATFRSDGEAWLALWTETGVRAQGGKETRGKAALRTRKNGLLCRDRRDRGGDRATARVYCREILFLKDGGVRKVVGIYDDTLVREGGAWRFERREYQLFQDEGRMSIS